MICYGILWYIGLHIMVYCGILGYILWYIVVYWVICYGNIMECYCILEDFTRGRRYKSVFKGFTR